MGNLSHYAGSGSNTGGPNVPGSPGETPDHGGAADGYASEDFVPGSSSSSRERKKGFFFLIIFLESFISFFFGYSDLYVSDFYVLRSLVISLGIG